VKKLSRIFLAAALSVSAGAASAGAGDFDVQTTFVKSGSRGGAEISASRDFDVPSIGVEKAFVGLGKVGDQRWAKLGVGFKPVSVLGVDISANAGIAHTDYKFESAAANDQPACLVCGPVEPIVKTGSKKSATVFVGFDFTKAVSPSVDLVGSVTHFDRFAHGPDESHKGQEVFGVGVKFKF
jgi:hypothetical protein